MTRSPEDLLPSARLELLAALWLHEPDAALLDRAVRELGLPAAPLDELAMAYADTFLMNVAPYGTVFTDPSGELNGPASEAVAARFAASGFEPRELSEVGAPDHLGLCLAHWAQVGADVTGLSAWGPVCCDAIVELPGVHPFHRALAERTLTEILTRSSSAALVIVPEDEWPPRPDLDEAALADLLRFLLTPARAGALVSRAELGRWARSLDLSLPFGSRWMIAELLFTAAGDAGRGPDLLERIDGKLARAAATYGEWSKGHPGWAVHAATWIARTDAARGLVAEMGRRLVAP